MTDFGEGRLVGIAGLRGSGKDEGGKYLEENHGFLHSPTGDLVREVARDRGLDTERQTLIDLGIQLRREYRSVGALVMASIEKWEQSPEDYPGGLAVTGMRTVGEAEKLLEMGGTLIFVEAMTELRHRRIVRRQRDTESQQTLKDFTARSLVEEFGDPSDKTVANLDAVRRMAHFSITNNYSKPGPYYNDIDSVLGLADR